VKNTTPLVILLLLISLFMPGCAGMNKAQTGMAGGMAAGAIAGQAVGRSTKGTLLGMALGGVLGYLFGNELDKQDALNLQHAYARVPDGYTSTWKNPDKNTTYSVTPKNTYSRNGQVCRDAEVYATTDGEPKNVIQTACDDGHGNWYFR